MIQLEYQGGVGSNGSWTLPFSQQKPFLCSDPIDFISMYSLLQFSLTVLPCSYLTSLFQSVLSSNVPAEH